ncbi:MAG: isoaspartyl peptidase/L-asparaginase family protein [Actinomycetota bacterium]
MSVLFVHGGVSGLGRSRVPSLRAAFDRATGSALDMIESAVCALEDHPELNAGSGAVLDREGRLELDAGISVGHGRTAGVANVAVRHPISLARRVLESTPHVLITGEGAISLGADMKTIYPSPEQLERWEKAAAAGELSPETYGSPEHVDTVGAVALDDEGTLAAGSSTGGVFGKLPGRVGDAPIFGAGIYTSSHVAVVGTGVGEIFLRTLACARVANLVEAGASPQEACEEIVSFLGTEADTASGLLALDAKGQVGAAFRGGSWAVEGPDGPLQPMRLT